MHRRRLIAAALLCASALMGETVTYSRLNGFEYRLELSVPAGTGPHPVIVCTDGGVPEAVRGMGFRYAIAALPPEISIEAAKAAIRWLRANSERYRLDDSRIAVWGRRTAAALGVTGGVTELEGLLGHEAFPSRVQAVIIDKPPGSEFAKYASIDDPPFLLSGIEGGAFESALRAARVEVSTSIDGVETFLKRRLAFGRPPAPRPPDTPVWADANRSEPAGTQYRTFFSKSAGTDVSYLMYLPPEYEAARSERYPVVYWLHNFSGNQRSGAPFVAMLDRAILAGQAPPMIVVLVNGIVGSCFTDSADGKRPVESVIVRDLIPHIDATYRTIATRSARAIEGFSMGGTGAAKFAFKYPELFGAVAVDAAGLPEESDFATSPDWFRAIYGNSPEEFRRSDPAWLAKVNAAKIAASGMHIRIAAGDVDPAYDGNHRLHRLLDELRIDHDFHALPGVPHSIVDFYKVLGVDGSLDLYRHAFAPERTFTPAAQERLWVVNQKHAGASDENAGTAARPFRTIGRAAKSAEPGDTVVVYEGVYRETVAPARGGVAGRPITYIAARRDRVVVKGSDFWKPSWRRFHDHPDVFTAEWQGKVDNRPAAGPRFPPTALQLFVDGEPFRESETLDQLKSAPRTWMLSPQGDAIYAHFEHSTLPPDLRTFEVAVRDQIFSPSSPGVGHIRIAGFLFEHCRQSGSAISTAGGNNWTVENNTIRGAKGKAVEIDGEAHLVRRNTIIDNGHCGICGVSRNGTRLVSNVLERNGAGIELSGEVAIEGNLIRDNEGPGVRIIGAPMRATVSRNVILNNLKAGILVEAPSAAVIDNNVIGYTRGGRDINSDGPAVTIAHNLIQGSGELPAGARNNIASGDTNIEVHSRLRQVVIHLGPDLFRKLYEPVQGVEADFYGARIPRPGPVRPGPFQGLRPGRNVFTLW